MRIRPSKDLKSRRSWLVRDYVGVSVVRGIAEDHGRCLLGGGPHP